MIFIGLFNEIADLKAVPVRNIFDSDFYSLLELYFTYDLRLNYRNEIAHGLIHHSKLSEDYSLSVILFICRLLSMIME